MRFISLVSPITFVSTESLFVQSVTLSGKTLLFLLLIASLLAPHRNTTESPLDDAVSTVVVRPKFYDDDDPLLSPRFVTIPETDTNDGDFRNVQVSLLPESAVVSVVCGYETRVVALRVKAPPPPLASGGRRRLLDPLQRAPVDLVIVLDIAGIGNAAKLQMVKRAMRLVVSSLGSADRFSIVASGTRLLPLKRMTNHGKRSAGVVVDGLLCGRQASNTSETLKKAARVLEDRRERNPIASIVLLSDGQSQLSRVNKNQRSIIEIPVTEYGFGDSHAPPEESFTKCIEGLLSVVVQDLRIQIRVGSGCGPCEISAVYLCNGRPVLVSSGSRSVRLGDLYAGEERDLLVELRIPSTASLTGSQQVLSVRGLYKDPSTQEVVYGRDQSLRVPQSVRSSTSPKIERLRSLFIMTRAVTEARRLVEYGECTSAHHLLTSALALLGRSGTAEAAAEYAKVVEAELVEVEWRRQQLMEYQSQQQQHVQRRRGSERRDMTMMLVDENGEPLTPTSTGRAMMKKSDLHGFENARF
ncbi:unnamed protein product [Microthlaspi erraticum]|uniref:VWFA domain-containing protein n=1 Tax=Microthlaspi erraticum TaxID=1685480 RepID=A0A6D2IGH3_9BRAS|nr:unnamed protein product [Microthlaspi erraticum]